VATSLGASVFAVGILRCPKELRVSLSARVDVFNKVWHSSVNRLSDVNLGPQTLILRQSNHRLGDLPESSLFVPITASKDC